MASTWIGLAGPALSVTGLGILLSGIWCVIDALLLWPSSVHVIELEEDGRGRWLDRSGRAHQVLATRASWASAGLIVLGLRTSRWRTRWLVLLPDAAAPEPLRQLRTWLKWRPA